MAITGGLLIYGTFDMPYFGSADAAVHNHVAPRYIYDSMKEIGVPIWSPLYWQAIEGLIPLAKLR